MHSADRHLRSKLHKSICNTTVAGGQSCRVWRTLLRRPQRPGNQSCAEAPFWRIPPSDSPSRITGHRRLCRNALAGHTEHLARMSTLCASHPDLYKQKPSARCAETVDAGDSLWKVVENWDDRPPQPLDWRPATNEVSIMPPISDNGASASKRIRAHDAETRCREGT